MENELTDKMIEEFSNSITARHLQAKPPREAYFYFPTEFEKVEPDEKNPHKTLRRIFEGNVNHTAYERLKVEELHNEIEKYNSSKKGKTDALIYPTDWKECYTQRFLQATGFNPPKTIEILLSHFSWRRDNMPPKITKKGMEVLNCGFIYFHGRDNRFRPIMTINVSMYLKLCKKFVYEDWECAVVYLLDYAIRNLLIPGQVENWNLIIDLKDASVMNIPNDLKKIIKLLQNNFRSRLFINFILNTGKFVSFLWGVVKKMIDPSTERKIKILKEPYLHQMFSFINPNQIEKKYGGKAENITSYFFPPVVPNNDFFKETDDIKKLFVTEEQYREIIRSNSSLIPSPFVDFKKDIRPKKMSTMSSSNIMHFIKIENCEVVNITVMNNSEASIRGNGQPQSIYFFNYLGLVRKSNDNTTKCVGKKQIDYSFRPISTKLFSDLDLDHIECEKHRESLRRVPSKLFICYVNRQEQS